MTAFFHVHEQDHHTNARRGRLNTRRGSIATPAFMPVGTQAAVKSLTPDEVAATGTEIILANTYHLMLRPGLELLTQAGSVQEFMGWNGPLLTDSGGFQVFSLGRNLVVRERGVEFRSHLDGARHELTPERAIELQLGFGSDIMMPLDQLVGYDTTDTAQMEGAERTQRWLRRSLECFIEHTNRESTDRPLLFGITQGGFDAARRAQHARRTADYPVDGLAVGGLSVGEPKKELFDLLAASVSGLPNDMPRYLMGVGSPEDLWLAVAHGIDMFDCVHPTRVARRGAMFTPDGRVNITAARYRNQFGPLDEACSCYACQMFNAAYIHHLFRAGELLGPRLATIHNIQFIQRQMSRIRNAIADGTFSEQQREFLATYRSVDETVARIQRERWLERRSRKVVT